MKRSAVAAPANINNILKKNPSQSKRTIPPSVAVGSPGCPKSILMTIATSRPPAVSQPTLRRFSSFQNGSTTRMRMPVMRIRISGRIDVNIVEVNIMHLPTSGVCSQRQFAPLAPSDPEPNQYRSLEDKVYQWQPYPIWSHLPHVPQGFQVIH